MGHWYLPCVVGFPEPVQKVFERVKSTRVFIYSPSKEKTFDSRDQCLWTSIVCTLVRV